MYRHGPGGLEVFLVHPGGPFFMRRDHGVWTVPKGEFNPGEEPLDVAQREFAEETGRTVEQVRTRDRFLPLGMVRQKGGKRVEAWAFEGEWPAGVPLQSNTFAVEWPPRSGKLQEFPEVDRGRFFGVDEASDYVNPAQIEFIARLANHLDEERAVTGPRELGDATRSQLRS
jgi:predicted NUDIX family NTP pyrophosphohydrolase